MLIWCWEFEISLNVPLLKTHSSAWLEHFLWGGEENENVPSPEGSWGPEVYGTVSQASWGNPPPLPALQTRRTLQTWPPAHWTQRDDNGMKAQGGERTTTPDNIKTASIL